MTRFTISSGHGKYVRGAAGPPPWGLDEVDEARRVVEETASYLRQVGCQVATYHDDVSKTQNENLNRIVDWHNSQPCDLACSIHFNAYQVTSKPMGTECLYVTQESLAGKVADKISQAGGFIDRGPKYRSDLFFLNNTAEPAILVETCFVDSQADAALYRAEFSGICAALAEAISGQVIDEQPVEPPIAPPVEPPTEPPSFEISVFSAFTSDIKCSVFGGGSDPNNSAYAPYDEITDSEISCALPWKFPDARPLVLVRNLATGREALCKIRDLGPWLTDDPYWQNNRRPLAETCSENDMELPRGPNEGAVPNGAGIDITPGAAKLIGLSGMGQVSWRFIEDAPTQDTIA